MRALGGLYTALVTPFRGDALDEAAFIDLVERQICAGVKGLVVAGTVGEAATLRPVEFRRLVELCVNEAKGRAQVVVSAGSNATAEAIGLVSLVRDLGADAAIVATPWYNRPSQEGIFRHYEALTAAVDFPILLGSAPSRSMVDISIETCARLGRLPGLVGIEDASGDVSRISAIRRTCPSWTLLSGHDPSSLGYMAYGGAGCVSLSANVAPDAMVTFQAACTAGDWVEARRWQDRLFPLHAVLARDPVPAGAKLALSMLGLCRPDVRLPLTAVSDEARELLVQSMRGLPLAVAPDLIGLQA